MYVEGHSDVGRVRGHNEDFFLVDHKLGLYVVCDGMGGHAAGEVASKTTAQTLQSRIDGRIPATIEEAVRALEAATHEANAKVYALGSRDRSKRGMGTTCTAVMLIGGRAALAHVGDSRLYLLRDGELHQLSNDHTFIAEALKHGILTPEQARKSEHGNVVTRAVGPSAQVIVDTLIFDVLPGDTLLLCSDGLTQYFDEGPALREMMQGDAEGLARRLVDAANEQGGEDNITALVLRMDPKEESIDAGRATQVQADFSALRHIHLLNELSLAELSRVCQQLESMLFHAGDTILEQGDVGRGLYVIAQGEVTIERDGQPIATLPAGAHFGEMALLTSQPRNATVRAATDCRVLQLDRDAFYGVVQQDNVIGIKFLWRLAQTLSLRLDEAYTTPQERERERATLRFGLFPSPFSKG